MNSFEPTNQEGEEFGLLIKVYSEENGVHVWSVSAIRKRLSI